MLDQVERRGFLVKPAGEDAAELSLRIAHVELDEGSGELLNFPGCSRFAGAEPHHDIADAQRLSGFHLKIA
jgi:hypothetical protein